MSKFFYETKKLNLLEGIRRNIAKYLTDYIKQRTKQS